MTWTELVDAVAEQSGVPRESTRRVLAALGTVAARWLATERDVPLRGLGRLTARWVEGRVVRSVADQRKMFVGGRLAPRFKAASSLRQALAGDEAAAWRTPEHQAAWRLAETLIGDLDLYHPDQAPSDLAPGQAAADVESSCADSFGAAWATVAATFAERAPGADVASAHYLGVAARRRWARP